MVTLLVRMCFEHVPLGVVDGDLAGSIKRSAFDQPSRRIGTVWFEPRLLQSFFLALPLGFKLAFVWKFFPGVVFIRVSTVFTTKTIKPNIKP